MIMNSKKELVFMNVLKCDRCNSTNVSVEEKIGRASVNPFETIPIKLISNKTTWYIYTCKDCGNEWKKVK